jgi:hypothetical protein
MNGYKYVIQERKAFLVTGRGGPYRCEMSRLPDFLDSQLPDGEVFSLTHQFPFTPGRFLVLISVRG